MECPTPMTGDFSGAMASMTAAGAEEEIGLGDVGGEEAVEVGGDDG